LEYEGVRHTGIPSKSELHYFAESRRIADALAEVITPETTGQWMATPIDAFDGLKPLEVREVDRVWRVIFVLRSGVPS
jgi:hypothetical protein